MASEAAKWPEPAKVYPTPDAAVGLWKPLI